MNATLKSICNFLREDRDRDLQIASIRVLGAVETREPAVFRAMGELLIKTDDSAIFAEVLGAIERNPHEQSMRFLLDILEREDGHEEQVQNAIVNIGPKAVQYLKRQFDRVTSHARYRIAGILPRIRSDQAHALLVECFFSPDHELVREAVHALREEIHHYEASQRNDLYARLQSALKDKRIRQNDAALSAVIIAFGIVADPRCKSTLLPFVEEAWPEQVRRHALMSLGRLDYPGDKHHDVFDRIHPLLDESDWEGVVRHAVVVLLRIKPRRSDNKRLESLLGSPHEGVRAYALQALGQLDSITHAEKVLPYLHHPDTRLRDAAGQALRQMPSAVIVILRHLDEVKGQQAEEMVDILEGHGNRIKPKQAREMFSRMMELYRAGDDHYKFYCTALRHLRGDVLQAETVKIADKAWDKKDYPAVRDALKLLDRTELMTPEIRFRLAVAKLKTSKKERSRTFRQSDYCLEHIAILLREEEKKFQRKFLAEKVLDDEDFLYAGFHFSERLNEERRFGADVLRHVVKKWPRRKSAAVARKKLQVEGH